jgi:hypothetical protein
MGLPHSLGKDWTAMKSLTCPACFLVALVGGAGLLRLVIPALQHPHYGPGFHHGWALTLIGLGLFLAGASFGVRVGLDECLVALHRRWARLLLIGGVSLGTTLAFLGLLAALTPLL